MAEPSDSKKDEVLMQFLGKCLTEIETFIVLCTSCYRDIIERHYYNLLQSLLSSPIIQYSRGMVEDRMYVDVARSLLEANNWNLQTAVDQIFDNPPGAAPVAPAPAGA